MKTNISKRLLAALLSGMMAVTILTIPAMAALPEPSWGSRPFTDVASNAWYAKYVESAYNTGIIDGTGDNKFEPQKNILYSEAVKMAACMHQKNAEGSVSLENGSPWYQPYVDYAKDNGIISKEYDWDASATRAGYAEIFANALPNDNLFDINVVSDGDIPDVPASHPQADAIYKLYRAGVVIGVDAQYNFAPDKTITRAEVVTVVARMMDIDAREVFNPVTDYGTPEDENPTQSAITLPTISDELIFSAGVGGWGNTLTLHEDGSFEGKYVMALSGSADVTNEYPNGEVYISTYSGKFTDIQKIDDYTYSMKLSSLQTKEKQDEWVEDGTHFIAVEPRGIYGGDVFYLYTPGKATSDFDENLLSWNPAWMSGNIPATTSGFVLYNPIVDDDLTDLAALEAGAGFYTEKDW